MYLRYVAIDTTRKRVRKYGYITTPSLSTKRPRETRRVVIFYFYCGITTPPRLSRLAASSNPFTGTTIRRQCSRIFNDNIKINNNRRGTNKLL